jgi:hypothetical protein
MRALRPGFELVLAAVAVVAVILLTRDGPRGGAPATAAEAAHEPRSCPVCIHRPGERRPAPIAESALVSAATRAAPAWRVEARR